MSLPEARYSLISGNWNVLFSLTENIELNRIELGILWNLKSSAPELDSFPLERVVLLVSIEIQKIQRNTVYGNTNPQLW